MTKLGPCGTHRAIPPGFKRQGVVAASGGVGTPIHAIQKDDCK